VKRSTNVKSEETTASELTVDAAVAAVNSVRRLEMSRRGSRRNSNEVSKGVKQKNVTAQTVVASPNSSSLNPDHNTVNDRQLKKNNAVLSHVRKVTFPKKKGKMKQTMKDQNLTAEKLIEKVETYNRVLSAMKNDFA